jgi:hypothetical protein
MVVHCQFHHLNGGTLPVPPVLMVEIITQNKSVSIGISVDAVMLAALLCTVQFWCIFFVTHAYTNFKFSLLNLSSAGIFSGGTTLPLTCKCKDDSKIY